MAASSVELGQSDRRVGELVQLIGKPQNLVSYHLAALRRAGIVRARRSLADGRDVYYRADLLRCRDLLGEAGLSLHPALALAPAPPEEVERRRARPRVLFLCTGNSARSQIAEALMEHRSAGTVEARSAGSHPKVLHPFAVRVMAERGVDIAGRPTKSVTRFARSRFDRVITLCDKVREICPEFGASRSLRTGASTIPPPPAAATRRCTPRSNAWPMTSTTASTCCLLTCEPDQWKGSTMAEADIVNVRYLVDDVPAATDFYTRHFGFTVGISSPAFADVTEATCGCCCPVRRAPPAGRWPTGIDRAQEAGTASTSSSMTSTWRSPASPKKVFGSATRS